MGLMSGAMDLDDAMMGTTGLTAIGGADILAMVAADLAHVPDMATVTRAIVPGGRSLVPGNDAIMMDLACMLHTRGRCLGLRGGAGTDAGDQQAGGGEQIQYLHANPLAPGHRA